MADVVLLSASAGLTACISRHVTKDLSSKLPSVKIALGISLALLSLSVLEATPSFLLVLLAHHDDKQSDHFTIACTYRWLLWMLCLWLIVVLPSLAGARLLAALAVDPEKKYSAWQMNLVRFVLAVPLVLFRLLFAVCTRLRRQVSRRVGIVQAEPVLVMTNSSSDGSRQSPSSGRNHPIAVSSTRLTARQSSFVIGGICGVVSTIAILSSLGGIVIQSSSDHGMHMLPTMVSWLCAVGLLLSSVLNGFGSVSLPHSCLVGIYLEPIGPEAIAKAKVELHKALSALDAKRLDLTSDATSPSADVTSVGRTWFKGGYTEEAAQRRQAIQREIDFLETLVEELEEDIEEMKHAKLTADMARTTIGKVRSWLGVVFSVVLLIRLYTSFTSILRGFNPATRRGDPITTALLWLTGHHLVSQEDYNSLSQCVSLVLTAVLSFSQVRMFLRTMSMLNARLLRYYRKCACKSKSQRTEHFSLKGTQIYADLVSALMGCYFLSCVVLTKMNLPANYRSSFVAALGGTDFIVQTQVANSVFCASAVMSAMILGSLFGIQRQNTKRHIADDTIGNLDAC